MNVTKGGGKCINILEQTMQHYPNMEAFKAATKNNIYLYSVFTDIDIRKTVQGETTKENEDYHQKIILKLG